MTIGEKTALLTMIQGHEPGARWKLPETRVTTIGRSSRNQVSLVTPTVSRFHCEISFINGLWYIADLNSKKGTYLNGTRIERQEVLKSGDIIRISKNVFRFELVDESAKDDEALLAIRDATLDRETKPKGEAGASLEDIRLRSRLSLEPEEEDSRPGANRLLRNVVFVLSVAFVAALGTAGTLTYGYVRVSQAEQASARREKQAAEALGKAGALAESTPPKYVEAIAALREVIKGYPDTKGADKAAARCDELLVSWTDNELQRVTDAEAAGNYRDALACTERLLKELSDKALKEIVEERRQFTERLARASFEKLKITATRLLDEKKPKEAIPIYLQAIERIGTPEVVSAADASVRQISQQYGIELPKKAAVPPGAPESGAVGQTPGPSAVKQPQPPVTEAGKPAEAPKDPEKNFKPPVKLGD